MRIAEPEAARAVADRVSDGRAEIGLTDAVGRREDLVVEHLVDQELVLVRPPHADDAPVRVAALASIEFVTTPVGTSTRRHLDEALARTGAEATIVVEPSSARRSCRSCSRVRVPRCSRAPWPSSPHGEAPSWRLVRPALRRSIRPRLPPGTLSPAAAFRLRTIVPLMLLAPRLDQGRVVLLGDVLPPLAPPLGADEDAQLRVPAVRDVGVGVEVVQAVVALLLARRVALSTARSRKCWSSSQFFSSISLGSGGGMSSYVAMECRQLPSLLMPMTRPRWTDGPVERPRG